MIKIQIDMSKKIPSNILNDITNLLQNVNNAHKDLKADKINQAKQSVKIAEPKSVETKVTLEDNSDNDKTITIPDGTQIIENKTGECPVKEFNDEKYDVRGFTWDKRIHARTKVKKADGTWRYRRGVDKELIKKVEAEQNSGVKPSEVVPEENKAQTTAFEIQEFTNETFSAVMFDYINQLMKANMIDKNYLIQLNSFLGLETGLVELLHNREKIPQFLDALVSANLAKRV